MKASRRRFRTTFSSTAGMGKSAWLKDPDGNTLAFQLE